MLNFTLPSSIASPTRDTLPLSTLRFAVHSCGILPALGYLTGFSDSVNLEKFLLIQAEKYIRSQTLNNLVPEGLKSLNLSLHLS